MKGLLNIRYIYKISTKRLASQRWDMTLTRDEAVRRNELIGLSSSNAIRMIDQLNGYDDIETEITTLKKELKELKKEKNGVQLKKLITKKYERLNELTHVADLIFVVMQNKKDYDRANKGFKVNGIEYVRLLATSGGVKKSTIIYVNKKIHDALYTQLNNNRDRTKLFVPAKLEAYLSLSFSSSIPVSMPRGVLVVHDVETAFEDDVILVDGLKGNRPLVKEVSSYESVLNACDGLGLMSPSLAQRWSEEVKETHLTSGVCVRNAFCKGMLFTFDFHQFAKEIAKTDQIVDVWGQWHSIEDVEVILTTSMLKLWDSYKSINDYLQACESNGYEFSVTKVIPEVLDNEQTMNYQFLQSLELTEDQIYELCKPTIDEFHDILHFDYRKTLLYLRGVKMNEENVKANLNDYITAIMINPNMMKDKYIFNKIKHYIKNRIDEAKLGVINVEGNFSIISGDPYLLCESMFGLELRGLLKKGEFYSSYWNERCVDEVAVFRAPMSVHNNIIKRQIVATDEMLKWYKYMRNITIFNAWDNSCSALNGADHDGDTVMTTNNTTVLRGIKETRPILCVQDSSSKKIPTEKDFIYANKQSFGSAIGTITNYATSIYNVMSKFEKGSLEWNELNYRVMCLQDYQQNEIDRAKGCISRPVPKEWYDFRTNKIVESDDEDTIAKKRFNLSLLCNKKPYFMIYNYEKLRAEYKQYNELAEVNCYVNHGMTVQELLSLTNKTTSQDDFCNNYIRNCPVNVDYCLSNKIAHIFESEFDYKTKYNFEEVSKDELKSDAKYTKREYIEVEAVKKQYDSDVIESIKNAKKQINNDNNGFALSERRKMLTQLFEQRLSEVCPNQDVLCNILVDICYKENKSKQLAWDVCGEQIIKNILIKHNNKMSFPVESINGNITFKGKQFDLMTVSEVLDEVGWR